jgi:hypothetical protein
MFPAEQPGTGLIYTRLAAGAAQGTIYIKDTNGRTILQQPCGDGIAYLTR